MYRPVTFIAIIALLAFGFYVTRTPSTSHLPKIAIANYGPHPSLDDAIKGLQDELTHLGVTADYTVSDVNFDPNLISQMLAKLKAEKPDVIVTLSTPVTQSAKNSIKDIPIVFMAITDPKESGLDDLPGASDKQDLNGFLDFAHKLLPQAKRIGLLYATGEANDLALVQMMQAAANAHHMELVAIPVDQSRDIPMRMQAFRDKVDFIYVGSSGTIQPALPAIIQNADQMHIPVFNFDPEAVKQNQALASYSVSYTKVGANAARLVKEILEGKKTTEIIYPKPQDHESVISPKRAAEFGVQVK